MQRRISNSILLKNSASELGNLVQSNSERSSLGPEIDIVPHCGHIPTGFAEVSIIWGGFAT